MEREELQEQGSRGLRPDTLGLSSDVWALFFRKLIWFTALLSQGFQLSDIPLVLIFLSMFLSPQGSVNWSVVV